MRVALVALTSLSWACGLFQTPCPERAEALAVRLHGQEEVAAEVDPWARPTVSPGPVGLASLAAVDLPYHAAEGTRAVAIDVAGQRFVDGSPVAPGRAALCGALGVPADAGHPPIRVHADATARGTAVVELLADLHSCKVFRLDLVFRRTVPPWIERSPAAVPADPPECPIDRTSVAAAHAADQPAELARVLVGAQQACGCPFEDEQVVAEWQGAMLPVAFVTTLQVRPSPSALPYEVGPDQSWQDAARHLVDVAGEQPFGHPVMLWFANEGSLTPTTDEVVLPPP